MTSGLESANDAKFGVDDTERPLIFACSINDERVGSCESCTVKSVTTDGLLRAKFIAIFLPMLPNPTNATLLMYFNEVLNEVLK